MKLAPSLEAFYQQLKTEFLKSCAGEEINSEDVSGIQFLVALPAHPTIKDTKFISLHNKIRMLGMLFCQPQHDLAKKQVIPNLPYFHVRSGRNINFYCCGYGEHPDLQDYRDKQQVCRIDDMEWLFSVVAFNEFREEMETKTRWKYSGEVDLLITDARLNTVTEQAELDFSSVVVCNLNAMVRDKTIPSIASFFEGIFGYAESQNELDPIWGFSDKMGLEKTGLSIRRAILSLLPKNLGADVERLAHLAVRDVSK